MPDSEKSVKIAALLKKIGAAFPHNQLSKESVELYTERLYEYPLNAIIYAVDSYIDSDNQFFPTIGKIKELADYWVLLRHKYSIMPADAFTEAVQELKEFDPGRGPRFSNPAIKEAVDRIGMRQLMASPAEYFERFTEAYKELAHKNFNELTQINGKKFKELKA